MNTTASKNNYFWVNFKLSIQNKKTWLVLILLNIMAVPYALVRYIFLDQRANISTIAISVIAIAFIFAAGLVIPLSQFDYLFNKSKVDMAYSLPLTRKQRFFSDYLSGLTIYISTLLGQFVLSFAISGIGLLVNNEFKKMFQHSYGELLLKFFFIMLLILLFLYTLTTFTVSCCGQTFEAVTSAIYVNILLISTLFAGHALLFSNLYGVDLYPIINRIIRIISPAGGGVVLIENVANGQKLNLLGWALPYIIVILLFLLLAYKNHVKRNAEDVSKPFVKKSFNYLVVTLFTFHIAAFSYLTFNSYINLVITSAFVFCIFEVITNRGFKNFGKSMVRFASIIAIILVVIISVEKTNCFNLVYRISKANNVKSITITDPTVFRQNNMYDFQAKLTKEESISKVIDYHKAILDYHKANGDTNYSTHDYSVKSPTSAYVFGYEAGIKHMDLNYDVSLGIDYSRSYYVPVELMMNQIEIELLDEVIDQRFDYIMNKKFHYNPSLAISSKYGQNRILLIPDYAIDTDTSKELIKELMTCIKEDLKEMSVEDYVAYDGGDEINLVYGEHVINLTSKYEKTMEFLKGKGYDLNELYTIEDYFITDQNTWIEILEPESYAAGYFYKAGVFSDYYSTKESNYTRFEAEEDLKTLLAVARSQYIAEEPCYKLLVNNNEFIIPSEYTELAREVFEKYGE